MFQRLQYILVALTFIFPFPAFVPSPLSALPEKSSAIHLIQSDTSGVIFDLQSPPKELLAQAHPSSDQPLNIPGIEISAEPGQPQVPVFHALIGIPAQSQLNLQILEQKNASLPETYSLPLAAVPAPIQSDLTPAGYEIPTKDASTLPDQWYPASPVRIEQDAWFRDQRFVSVAVYPFQYNPRRGTLLYHSYLKAQVTFSYPPGTSHVSNPFSAAQASSPIDDALRSTVLNYDTARAWRAAPPGQSGSLTGASMPVQNATASLSGPAFRIAVDQDGLYQITYSQLSSTGLDLSTIDPHSFHMTNQGRDVAIDVSGEGDGQFNPGDTVTFYGQQFHGDYMAQRYSAENRWWITYTQQLTTGLRINWHPSYNATQVEKYTNENVYWLAYGGAAGPRISTQSGDPAGGGTPTPDYYRTTVHAEQSNQRWEYHFTSEDTWFWEWVHDTLTHTYTTTLSAVAPGIHLATVRGEVVAFTYNDSASPDHNTRFSLNNTASISNAYWDGESRFHFTKTISQTNLLEGTNRLDFAAYDVPAPSIWFDWFEIEYDRLFQAAHDQIQFLWNAPGTWIYQITGFTTPDLRIYDVTHPLLPVQITSPAVSGSASAYSLKYRAVTTGAEQYYALASSQIQAPKSISIYTPHLAMATNGADYIIVAPSVFMPAAQTLANYRSSQGLRSMVVDIQDVYNEFNDGITNPLAIKNMLAYAFSHWTAPAPSYILLVGDGHFNMRGFNPSKYGTQPVFIPPNLGFVDPWQGEVDASNLLVNVVGQDPVPDVALGRILVDSVDELNTVINKVIAYESTPVQSWQRNMIFVSDNVPDPKGAGDFVGSSEALIHNFVKPGFTADRIYLNNFISSGQCLPNTKCPQVNHAITTTLSITGSLFVNYIGHASIQYWAGEQILLYRQPPQPSPYKNDIGSISTTTRLPIVFSQTCLDGYFIRPDFKPSLAELWLKSNGRGAVATFSPGGLGVSAGHDVLADGFYGSIFQNGNWNLGAATIAAKLAVFTYGYHLDLVNTYVLMGDPALHILNPYGFTATPSNSQQISKNPGPVYHTLHIKNTGAISDTFSIQVSGNNWQTSAPASLGPIAPGADVNITVTVTIPSGLSGSQSDSANLLITSLGDASQKKQSLILTNYAQTIWTLSLPIIFK